MKEWFTLLVTISGYVTAIVAFCLTVLAGFGRFTPDMDPWWLVLTVPASIAAAIGIAAAAFKLLDYQANR